MSFPLKFHRPYSIRRLVLICFIAVALVPVSLLGIKLYQAAWENAWREIDEKHKVLAKNLSAPILIFIRNHQTMLSMTAAEIRSLDDSARTKNTSLLKHTISSVPAFQALTLMTTNEQAHIIVQPDGTTHFDTDAYSNTLSYIDTVMNDIPQLSNAIFSPLDNKPTILITYPVYNQDESLIGVLIAELRISILDELRKGIEFGKDGHSVIVDATGRVISHPNSEWMASIQNISDGKIVQAMMAGETGVTEFYSSWRQEQMVAGYTSIPGIRWGIMVPQPRKEVEAQVYSLLYTQFTWALAGLVLAILLATLLARWITSSMQSLVKAANTLAQNNYQGELPGLNPRAPNEVQQLDNALRHLINGLLTSREEVNDLNKSLQQRIEDAIAQLKITNNQLSIALEKREEFARFARHDLRKPIAVIVDITEILSDEINQGYHDSKAVTEKLELINKTTKYMGSIVDDFLSKEAFADGRITLNKSLTNLNHIVHLMYASNKEYAKRKGIQLHLQLDESIQAIEIDDARISQVCQNLIDNAVKFCRQGDQVMVSTRQLSNEVEVCVSDTGPGLTAQDLTLIFNKDIQLSNKPTGGEISTGTGLLICKQIIDLHNGHIGVENNSNGGCRFCFRLS